jgi:hypothetical protein
MIDAVQGGVASANAQGEQDEKARKQEEDEVKELLEEYDTAVKFDKACRAQYALDRRYAAGTADLTWRVSANLIGTYIDILVSFLYARNPDVSAKKNPQVDNSGTRDMDDFAKTMQLVISSLWRRPLSFLKKNCRKQVRSALSVGIGWLKGYLVCNGSNIPELESQLGDARDNAARLEALQNEISEQGPLYDGPKSPEEVASELGEIRDLSNSLAQRMEVAIRKNLATDSVKAEDIQVSLDVDDIMDYLNAGWVAQRFYKIEKDMKAAYPRLVAMDWNGAKCYYRKARSDTNPVQGQEGLTGIVGSGVTGDEADTYVSDTSSTGTSADQSGPKFYKGIELWNKNTGHVYTMMDGVKRWAKEPYQPDYPTSRFYPFFGLAFFNVEGERHPQSLTQRLRKLQDEYSATRSSERVTRERSIPGIMFDATNVPDEEAQKLTRSSSQELIAIKTTNPDKPLRDSFAEKPVSRMDMRLYDTTSVRKDMEGISGVQEALQSNVSTPKTATEAEIEQSGFASRTTADRDCLEDMLTDYASYTGEQALTAIDNTEAARIAGAKTFWPGGPGGMSVDDLLTMVSIEIEAGTTGKPHDETNKEAWGVILPQLTELQMKIHQAQLLGDIPLANALTEMLRETMQIMGVTADPMRFIPQLPQLPAAGPLLPGDGAGGPPSDSTSPDGGPPIEAGMGTDMVPPDLMAPALEAPGLDEPPA